MSPCSPWYCPLIFFCQCHSTINLNTFHCDIVSSPSFNSFKTRFSYIFCNQFVAGICSGITSFSYCTTKAFVLSCMGLPLLFAYGLIPSIQHYSQFSSSPLEPDLGHNCRTPLNPLLCLCNSPEIHSEGYSQLKR